MKKSIKHLIASFSCCTLLLVNSFSVVQAGDAMVIRVLTSQTLNSCQMDPFVYFKKNIEEASSGRIKVDFMLGFTGSNTDIAERIQMGVFQMGSVASSNMSTMVPEFGALEIPFLITDSNDYLGLYYSGPKGKEGLPDSPFFDIINKSLLERNLRIINVCPFQFRSLGLTKKGAYLPEDVKGIKLRSTASQVEREVISTLGMSPTMLPYGEVYTALQQHVVDGVGLPIDEIVAMKFDENINLFNDVHYNSYHAMTIINEEWYQKLSKEDRLLFENAWKYAFMQNHKTYNKRIEAAFDKVKNNGKMDLHFPSADEMAKWEKTAQPVIKKLSNNYDAKILELIKALKDKRIEL